MSSIRRTRKGEMILELKKRKGATWRKRSVAKVSKWGSYQATLQVKSLDEVTEAEELVMALRQQCEGQEATVAVRLRKGPRDTGSCVADVKKSA